uniref:Uncharacterized protein n=1 Tax=Tetranychus urticae TaxID=32264 RepID=T1JRU8_TETUR
MLAKFNDQMKPLYMYMLLKEVEDIKIPADLLEPDPIEVNGSTIKVTGFEDDERSFLLNHIYAVESEKFFSYIHDHLYGDRIVFFEFVQGIKAFIRIFSLFQYVHKFIEKSKKKFLQRATYSCVEMGLCLDALDQAVETVLAKILYKTCAQCKRYEQVEIYPIVYHPVAFVSIKDLIYLFVLLLNQDIFVEKAIDWLANILHEVAMLFNNAIFKTQIMLKLKLIHSSDRDKPAKGKKPFLHYSSNGSWHNIAKSRRFC